MVLAQNFFPMLQGLRPCHLSATTTVSSFLASKAAFAASPTSLPSFIPESTAGWSCRTALPVHCLLLCPRLPAYGEWAWLGHSAPNPGMAAEQLGSHTLHGWRIDDPIGFISRGLSGLPRKKPSPLPSFPTWLGHTQVTRDACLRGETVFRCLLRALAPSGGVFLNNETTATGITALGKSHGPAGLHGGVEGG